MRRPGGLGRHVYGQSESGGERGVDQVLVTGERVAVKVQKPGVQQVLQARGPRGPCVEPPRRASAQSIPSAGARGRPGLLVPRRPHFGAAGRSDKRISAAPQRAGPRLFRFLSPELARTSVAGAPRRARRGGEDAPERRACAWHSASADLRSSFRSTSSQRSAAPCISTRQIIQGEGGRHICALPASAPSAAVACGGTCGCSSLEGEGGEGSTVGWHCVGND